MPAPIHIDPSFQARRTPRTALDRALPHRRSYLGFTLGLVATVVVVMSLLGWWLVQTGVVQVWSYPRSGVLTIQLRWP